MSEQEHKKVIIIGSGPAGYTAAIYSARANLSPFMITGAEKGGQLTTTTEVDNFTGFPEGIDGTELMTRMEKQAVRFGTELLIDNVTSVDTSKRPFTVKTAKKTFTSDAIIIATGASARWLGLETEEKYKNRGVSACATCDGFFFRGQEVAVVGGGDTALEEATFLTNFCSKVYLVHRRDSLRGSKAMQDRAFKNEKIEFVWDSAVDEVIGNDDQGMTDLRIKNLKTGETKNLGVTGMFVAIGHTPNTSLFDEIELDEQGYIKPVERSSKTNIEGVFACGDVVDSVYRQAITAAGSGCSAAIDSERWLAEQEA
ncbi:MAG: thioredoxin reductase (NADPH) [bacterium]|jgi:thioredoxin reductase (NADPH)